ncbi:MAG: PA2778 family cysteine peptidase [Candidatus Omnitrophota bacterium]
MINSVNIVKKNLWFLIFIIFIPFLNYGCSRGHLQIEKNFFSQENHFISQVPFYKQIGNTCGPAALASLLAYWGIEFDYHKLIKELYTPRLGGAIDFEIAFYPRQFGLWSKYSQTSFSYLKERIKENIPLIVLTKELPVKGGYHYTVIFGFDEGGQKLLAHTGRKSNVWLNYKTFIKKWKKADFGTITICPPEKVNWDISPDEYVYLGYLLEKKGQWEKAIEYYQKAINITPQKKIAFFNLGNVYFKKGEFAKAEEFYRKAIEIDKNFAEAYNNLAYLYFSTKRNLREAEKLVMKAIELNPTEANYLDTLEKIKKEVE